MPMKGYNPVLIETFIADAAITQFQAMVQGASDYHAAAPGAENAANFVGVALDAANVDETVPTVMIGTMWMVAGSAVSAGDQVLIANAQGQIENNTTLQANQAGATPHYIGRALSSASAAGDYVLVKLS